MAGTGACADFVPLTDTQTEAFGRRIVSVRGTKAIL
ncbi:hypothetical protein JNB_18668 [Janibacter sp. HTCC2649]|nr:hypothetical protein JNB_18668 [Janibacter sp. HTCC2649]